MYQCLKSIQTINLYKDKLVYVPCHKTSNKKDGKFPKTGGGVHDPKFPIFFYSKNRKLSGHHEIHNKNDRTKSLL